MLEEGMVFFNWSKPYFISQFLFVALGLIFVVTLGYILHYGFGAMGRMEKILEEILKGDSSLRIYLRKKDILRPFAERLNKILDLLDDKRQKK